jgi:hypothetical protein
MTGGLSAPTISRVRLASITAILRKIDAARGLERLSQYRVPVTPRRLLSLALTLVVVGIAIWPRSPSSRVGMEDAPAAVHVASSTRRMPVHGAGIGCSSCHVLGARPPAELACREAAASAILPRR